VKNSHERGADWYNDIIKNAGKAQKGLVGKERDEAINKILTEAIVKLKQTVNPHYAPNLATQNRISKISRQMSKSGSESFIIRSDSDIKGDIITFFTSIFGNTESPADFFDKKHRAVIAMQERMGMKYCTEPGLAEPKSKSQPKVRSEQEINSTTPSSISTVSGGRRNSSNPSEIDHEPEPVTERAAKAERFRITAAKGGNPDAAREVMKLKLSLTDSAALRKVQQTGDATDAPKVSHHKEKGSRRLIKKG
jgi:hypothetical protein